MTHRVVGGNMPLEVADRFYDTCDALGTTQTAVLKGLVDGWLAQQRDVPAGQDSLPIDDKVRRPGLAQAS